MMRRAGCLLLLFALGGCQTVGIPADPLFANRQPAASNARTGPPATPAFSEPTPPVQAFPAIAVQS
ncbi:MAG: hypothetical protein HY289_03015 [Planctomycetes bacterium]|nr:hypothetical protein [Planctomycetota bacterium]